VVRAYKRTAVSTTTGLASIAVLDESRVALAIVKRVVTLAVGFALGISRALECASLILKTTSFHVLAVVTSSTIASVNARKVVVEEESYRKDDGVGESHVVVSLRLSLLFVECLICEKEKLR